MKIGKSLRHLYLLLWLPLPVFAAFLLNHAISLPPITDDAWMATIAKNWANGYGWSSSYGEIYPFDPQITTGPGLLAFVALGIKLFGNALWVPRVFALLLHLMLLLLFLFQVQILIRDRKQFSLFACLLVFLFASLHWHMWIVSLGDLSALLYSLNAITLVCIALQRVNRTLFTVAGIFAGLAILSKLIAIVPLAALTLFLLCQDLAANQSLRGSLKKTLLFLCPMILLPLCWQYYEYTVISSLDSEQQLLHQLRFDENFAISGSGLAFFSQHISDPGFLSLLVEKVSKTLASYNDIVAEQLRLVPQPLVIIAGLVFIFWFCTLEKSLASGKTLANALLFCALAYLFWAIVIGSSGFGRYIFFGIYLSGCGLFLLLSRNIWLSLLILAYFGLNQLFPPLNILYGNLRDWHTQPAAPMQALEETIQELETHYNDKPLASCSNIFSREIEYGLTGINRLPDCHYLLGKALEPDITAYLEVYPDTASADRISVIRHFVRQSRGAGRKQMFAPVQWKTEPTGFYAVQNPLGDAYTGFGRGAQYTDLTESCITRFDNGFYRILDCQANQLKTGIASRNGINFIPPQWLDEYRLNSNPDQYAP